MDRPPVARVGERIRVERQRQGVSLRSLARTVGVSASFVSQIETGKCQPSVSTLYAITTALGVSIEDVFEEPRAAARADPAASAGPVPEGTGQENIADGSSAGRGAAAADGAAADPVAGDGTPGDGAAADGAAGDAATAGATAGAAGGSAARAAGPGGGVPSAAPPSAVAGAVAGLTAAAVPVTGSPVLAPGRRAGPLVRPVEREVLELDSGVTWERLGHVPGIEVDFLLVTYPPGSSSSSTGQLMRHAGTEYGYLIEGELIMTLGFDDYLLAPGDAINFRSATPHRYRNDGAVPAVGVWFVTDAS